MDNTIKYYCHAPSHNDRVLIGFDDDDVYLHLVKKHGIDIGTEENYVNFKHCYVEEVECQK